MLTPTGKYWQCKINATIFRKLQCILINDSVIGVSFVSVLFNERTYSKGNNKLISICQNLDIRVMDLPNMLGFK